MVSLLYDNYVALGTSWAFGVGGFLGNISIIGAISRYYRKSNGAILPKSDFRGLSKLRLLFSNETFTVLMLNLAISDLMGAIYLLIIASSEVYHRTISHSTNMNESTYYNASFVFVAWHRSPMCYFARCCNILASVQSIYITSIIATDRYLHVVYPYSRSKRLTPLTTVILVLAGWFLSGCIAAMFTIYARITVDGDLNRRFHFFNLCVYDNIDVGFVRMHVFAVAIMAFLLYLYMLIMYILIICKLREYRRTRRAYRNYPNSIQRKLIRLAVFISLTNFLVWFPAIAVGVAAFTSYSGILRDRLVFDVTSPLMFIFQANTTINPIIFWHSASHWSGK